LFNSGSTGFAADSGAVRAAAAAVAAAGLGRMVGRTTGLGALGIGTGSTLAVPGALGKDIVQEPVGIGMTEVVGRVRRATAVPVVGTAAAAAVVVVVGCPYSTSGVVGVGSTGKGVVVVTVDYWGCSSWMVDLAPVDRTGQPWLAHKLQARKGNSHCHRTRSKVVFGSSDSRSVCCCTDNYCSRDALGSNHSRVGLDTKGTVVGKVVDTVVDKVGGTVVGMGVDRGVVDTVDRAEGSRCCLLDNKVCDSSQLEKGTCVPGSISRYPHYLLSLLLLPLPLLLLLLLLPLLLPLFARNYHTIGPQE